MAMPPPIRADLSLFEKIHILRTELEERREELAQLEATLLDKLQAIEIQRYLESLNPFYAANRRKDLPTREEIEQAEKRRAQLYEVIETIEKTLSQLLAATGEKEPPPPLPSAPPPLSPTSQGPRKVKFDF